MLNKSVETILYLLAQSLCKETSHNLQTNIDWNEFYGLCVDQGAVALVFEGIHNMMTRNEISRTDIDEESYLKMLGISAKMEQKYLDYHVALKALLDFCSSHNYKVLLFKGASLSQYYPSPQRRPCGDIDIWCYGNHDKLNDSLRKELGIRIDTSERHHTVFNFKNEMVENHYDFLEVHGHRSNKGLEKALKELAENSILGDIEGSKVYFPCPDFNAIYLLRHTACHFASTGSTIRNIIDWGLFVEKCGKDVNWDMVYRVARKYNMDRFLNCQNAICVNYLGFESDIFPEVETDCILVERVVSDLFMREFSEMPPKDFIVGLFFKFRRWKQNSWKHKLVFNESLVETFFTQLWSHLLKPSSLKN